MKVLFASAHCLLDRSSGAALGTATLLHHLQAGGHQALALGARVFDTEAAAQAAPSPPAEFPPLELFSAHQAGVRHLLLPTRSWRRGLMLALEEEALERHYRRLLDQAPPDAVIVYGGMLLERSFLAEARRRGIRTVFQLVNPSYRDRHTFADVDLLVTDSQATADLYRQRLGLTLHVLGPLIDPEAYQVARRQPRFITFVNPSLEKGAALVARLALMAAAQQPSLRFLVVESRGRWPAALEALNLHEADFPNLEVWPMQSDMRRVYAQTKLLLVPSFWHESGGRVALEAMLNGIPVLAASHGGIQELLDGGGILLPIPEPVRQQPRQLVEEADALPWFDTIRRLSSDAMAYGLAGAAAREAARRFQPGRGAERLLQLLTTQQGDA